MIHESIEIVTQIIFVLLFLLICFSVYLIVKRMRETTIQRKINNYINVKQQLWYQYFRDKENNTDDLIPKNEIEIQGIERIFLVYLRNISNEVIQEKIRDFSNQFLKEYYQTLLTSRKWSKRINALHRIADFKLDSLIGHCYSLEKKKSSQEETFHLLKIYSLFDANRFIDKIIVSSLSEFEYTELLIGLNEFTFNKLRVHFNRLPKPCQYSFIEIIGNRQEIDWIPFLEEQLQHEDAEVRIRSLKSLHKIGVILDVEKYVPFINSSLWEERLMVAKLLQNMHSDDYLLYVEQLLDDESWWVRSEAAQAVNKKVGKTAMIQ